MAGVCEARRATAGFPPAGAAPLFGLMPRAAAALAVAGRLRALSSATTASAASSCATIFSLTLFEAAFALPFARASCAVGQATRADGCSGASVEGPSSRETTSSARLVAPLAAVAGRAGALTAGPRSPTTRSVSSPRALHHADPQHHSRAKADAHRRRSCSRPTSLKSRRTSMFSSRSEIKCWQ